MGHCCMEQTVTGHIYLDMLQTFVEPQMRLKFQNFNIKYAYKTFVRSANLNINNDNKCTRESYETCQSKLVYKKIKSQPSELRFLKNTVRKEQYLL